MESTMSADKGEAPDYLTVRFLGQDNKQITFKIKRNRPLKKLMNRYCKIVGIHFSTARFRYGGQAIVETDTTSSLNICNEGIIELYQEQIGG